MDENRKPVVEQSNMSSRLSRRDFLAGAVKIGVGLPAASSLLAACVAPAPPPAAPTAAPAAVSSGPRFKGTKLTAWVLGGAPADAFQDQAPKILETLGIELDMVVLPYQQLFEKVVAGAKTGDLPDLVPCDYPWTGSWIEGGALAPVDEFMNNPDLADPNFDLADFIPSRLKSHGQWRGEQFGFPWWVVAQTMLYRTDVFEQAGLEPPSNWDEWLEAAKKLQGPEFWIVALPASRSPEIHHPFRNRLYTHGGDWVSESLKEGGKGEILINNDIAVKALEMLREHLTYADPSSISYGYGEVQNAFLTGAVATSDCWTDTYASAQDPDQSKIVGKVSSAEIPAGTQRGSALGGWFLGMTKTAKNKEAAFKVVEFLTSKKPLVEQGLKFGVAGGRYSFYQEPEIIKQFPGIEIHVKALETAVARPRIPEYFQMADILALWLSKAIAENVPSKEALDSVAKEWEPLVAKYNI